MASATPLLHGLVLEPLAWSGLRFLTGFCFSVLFVVIESWLNEQSTNETRGLVFSTYAMITLTLIGVGQMMMVLYSPEDMHLFAIASVLVSIAAIPVVLSTGPKPEQPVAVELNLKEVYKVSPAASLGCVASGLANGTFWSLAPVFVAAYSSDVSLAALFMTAGVIGGAIAQWPVGFLSNYIGRRKTLIVAAAAGAAIAAVIVFHPGDLSPIRILALGVMWGAVAFPQYPIAVAHANDYAEPSQYVLVSSGLLLMYGSGAVIGPFVASAVMTIAGATGMFVFTGFAHFALVLYATLRISRRTAAPSEQHIAFGDALATAATASQVYDEEIQHQAELEEEEEND